MSDDFFERLRNDWRDQDTEIEAIRLRLRRWRWLPHAMLAAESLAGLAVIATGVWFAIRAVAQQDLVLGVSALVCLGIMPVALVVLWRTRWPALAWQEETAEGVLALALTRLRSMASAVRLGRWSVWTLLAMVVTLWTAAALGLTPATPFLILATTIWLATALAGWLWLSWRAARLTTEIDRCEQLQAEYRG